jgi:signal transduction histidine kinase
MRIGANRINTNLEGFAEVVRIYQEIRNQPEGEVFVNCEVLDWLDANMCAPLAAAIVAPGRRVRLQHLRPDIEMILRKNRFLRDGSLPDTHGTTIACQQFEMTGSNEFELYVAQNFRGKGLPAMSPRLQRRFRMSIFELFENAVAHSRTQLGIFACGQYFPSRERLHFCLADRGVGIPANVRSFVGKSFDSSDAIDWAMSDQNTTRLPADGVPGGIGLKMIRDFIGQNGGAIHVSSDDGYWSLRGDRINMSQLPAPFPGTVVDIEINTADKKRYDLADQIDPLHIF